MSFFSETFTFFLSEKWSLEICLTIRFRYVYFLPWYKCVNKLALQTRSLQEESQNPKSTGVRPQTWWQMTKIEKLQKFQINRTYKCKLLGIKTYCFLALKQHLAANRSPTFEHTNFVKHCKRWQRKQTKFIDKYWKSIFTLKYNALGHFEM